ncbi:MAG TPA: hemolysin family protein [Candidatus Binatia bacterium]
MAFEIVAIFLLLIANGIFAMSEIAVVTARKSRLEELANQGIVRARAALELAKNPNRFLSTVQIGITLVGILAGAFGGGTLTAWLAAHLSAIPGIAPYSRSLALGAVVLGITYCSVIIGELVPKRLALGHPEPIAMFMALPMRLLLKVCAPVVHFLSGSTDLVFRLFGKRFDEPSSVTEEEIRTLIRQGTKAGVFDETEQDMVEAVFQLGDMSARGLMTPRTQIIWLDVNDSIEQIRAKLSDSGHSRFPVCAKSLDDVVGVVQAKDILASFLLGKSMDLRETMQQAAFVPRSMTALQVLDHIKQSSSHIVLVVDEYGGIEGLLTHHDLLEAIAGDMPLGKTPAEPKAVQRSDGSWLLDGMMSVDEFKEVFQLENVPGEKRDTFQTLGGFLFTQMGRLPSVSEYYEWNHLRFEIVDMDGKRIDKVLVSPVQKSPHFKVGEGTD